MNHRSFYFELPVGGRETQWANDFTTIRSSFDASVFIRVDGKDNEILFDEICDEAILLMNAVNLSPSGTFAAGVDFVQAQTWRLEAADDGLYITISFSAETEESDGAP